MGLSTNLQLRAPPWDRGILLLDMLILLHAVWPRPFLRSPILSDYDNMRLIQLGILKVIVIQSHTIPPFLKFWKNHWITSSTRSPRHVGLGGSFWPPKDKLPWSSGDHFACLSSLAHQVCWSNCRLRLGFCILMLSLESKFGCCLLQNAANNWLVNLQCFSGDVKISAESIPISINLNLCCLCWLNHPV